MIEEVADAQPAPQNQPAQETKPASAAGAENPGKLSDQRKWMKQLEADLQDNEFLAQFDSFSGPARKLLEIEGKKDRLVEIPDSNASEEVKKRWREVRGLPANAEAIAFQLPTLPAGLQFVESDIAEFRQWAFKNELTPKQAQAALELDTARQVARYQAVQARQKAAQEAAAAADRAIDQQLRSELGDRYQSAKEAARANVGKLFSPAFVEALEKAGVLSSALAFKEFHALEARLGDTPFLRGGNPAGAGGGKSRIRGMENVLSVKRT